MKNRSLILLVVLLAAGCKSPPIAGQGSIAWVKIPGSGPAEIGQATKEVFTGDGYKLVREEQDQFLFEKPGNGWHELTYGGWGEGMVLRVHVLISPENAESLLHCRAYLVHQPGDKFFEDKHEVTRLGRGPYQKLLERVKAALESSN
jgi:hypothetical protein